MPPVKKRCRGELTIEQKLKLLGEVDEKKEMRCVLASKYNIAVSTLSAIIKNRDRLEENVRSGVVSGKRHRTPKYGDLENKLYEYLSQAVIANMPITDAMLKEEADVIALSLNISNFKSSYAWLHRFMKRFNIKFSDSKAIDTTSKPKLQKRRMHLQLTMSEKIKLLRDVDEKKGKKREIAAKYHIPASTLSTILKQRNNLEGFVQNGGGMKESSKRLREGKHNDLENELYEYYAKTIATNVPVSGHMLKEYAKLIALKLNIQNFESSNGWLHRFFKRFDIDIEKKSVHQELTMFEDNYLPYLPEEVEKEYMVCSEDFNEVTTENIAMDFEPWEDVVDFSGNCRLCLSECNDLTEIFSEISDPNDSWVHKITSLIPIELQLTDGLPQGLCKDCVLQLSQTHSFISNSLLVDAWLRNRLNAQTDEMKGEIVDSEVEIVPHGEDDPLAFEQYQHFEQQEQEGSDYDPDGDFDQFNEYQDDELDDETYVDKPLKRKRGRPLGSTKNKPKQPYVYLDNFNDDTEPRKRGRPRKYPTVPAASDLPKRKRGRPSGSKKPLKEKPAANENYDCTVCRIKFFSQQTLTKHIREKACVAAPEAGPVAEVSPPGLAKVKIDRVESLNEFPDKDSTPPDVDGATNEGDDDWWNEEAKETSDADDLDLFGDNHDDPVIFTCAECGKTFTAHKSLKRHMRYHNERGRFRCDMCPLLFCNQTEQVEHYRTHTGDKPYACDKCPKSFTLQTSLTKHERTHTGERPYACPSCPKTFTLKCSLRKHKRIHTGERPFACTLCPKTFASHTTRKMHVRTHTGEKPFTCNFCPMSFVETSKRTLHERRVHTKECTVKCTACDKMFIDVKKRAVHMRKEHNEVP